MVDTRVIGVNCGQRIGFDESGQDKIGERFLGKAREMKRGEIESGPA